MSNIRHPINKLAARIKDTTNQLASLLHELIERGPNLEQSADVIKEMAKQLDADLAQGEDCGNHFKTFEKLKERANAMLSERDGTLDVKVVAVSSTYSWNFLTSFLPELIKSKEGTYCQVSLAMVHPEHLRQNDVGDTENNDAWSVVAEGRMQKAKAVTRLWRKKLRDRYRLKIFFYRNLPHWHGVLLNDTELYLGRTTWRKQGKKWHLRVGENNYRYFASTVDGTPSNLGEERVFIFKNWFHVYSKLLGEPLNVA